MLAVHVEQAESLMSHSDNITVTDGMQSEFPHGWEAWGGLCWVPFNTAESWSASTAALQPHKQRSLPYSMCQHWGGEVGIPPALHSATARAQEHQAECAGGVTKYLVLPNT